MPYYLTRRPRSHRARNNMSWDLVTPDGIKIPATDAAKLADLLAAFPGSTVTEMGGSKKRGGLSARPKTQHAKKGAGKSKAPSTGSGGGKAHNRPAVYEDEYAQIGKSVGWDALGYPYLGKNVPDPERARLKAAAKAAGVSQFRMALTELGLTPEAAEQVHSDLDTLEILCLGRGECYRTTPAQQKEAWDILAAALPAKSNPRRRRSTRRRR
jgi:hypothetical protein